MSDVDHVTRLVVEKLRANLNISDDLRNSESATRFCEAQARIVPLVIEALRELKVA